MLCILVCSCSGGLNIRWNLYQISKGDLCILRCGQALCANSIRGNRVAQSSCWKFLQIQRYCSISWFTHSNLPSICGWKAVDNFCLIPSFLHNSCITCVANCGPWSDIIVEGKPVRFQTLSNSNWLVLTVVIFLLHGERIIALLWRSTTVRMLSYPLDVGRSVMKSIVMVSHNPCGISFGLIGTFTGGVETYYCFMGSRQRRRYICGGGNWSRGELETEQGVRQQG